jgi:vancomycin permeability regulator SanA
MRILKKITAFIFALILLTPAVILGINHYVKSSAEEYIVDADETDSDFDCILVLGCKVNGDSPSLMLRDRLSQGVGLYGIASDRILMTGDHGRDGYDEVGVMKAYAEERGVPSRDVFEDHAGFSTYESMYRAKEVFRAKKILIVTQEYHLYRAIYDARALGLDAYGVIAEPSMDYGNQLYFDFREVLARNKDFVFSIVKPKPTYLGDAIPISGNGEATQG